MNLFISQENKSGLVSLILKLYNQNCHNGQEKKSCNSKAKSRKWQLIYYWQTLFLSSKSFEKNCNTQILKTVLHFLQFWKLLQQLNENFKAKSRKWQLICYWLTFSLSYQNSKATVLNYRCLWPNYREKGNNNLSRFGHMIC